MTHTIPATKLRPMEESDLSAAYALSVEVGWPHRPDDWRFVHEIGNGIVACDGAGRIVSSAMWWSFGSEFGTVGMVIVSPRLQARGIGREMMRVLFDQAGDRTLKLNSTTAGFRLYEAEGFEVIGEIHQQQGQAVVHAKAGRDAARQAGGSVRAVDPSDWARVEALDAEAYGADRRVMLKALAKRAVGSVFVKNGQVVGFSFCRPFGRGHAIGPIVASNDATAIALTAPHLATHADTFVRADAPFPEGEFMHFLELSGLARVSTVITMVRGPYSRPVGSAKTYAIVNQALG